MQKIYTPDAPPPFGHYSQAVAYDGLVYVSGQLPVLKNGAHSAHDPFDVQARRVLGHLVAILNSVGASTADVLKVSAYIVGVENWPVFNAVYTETFHDVRPARSVVPVGELHHGYLVELDAIARLPQ